MHLHRSETNGAAERAVRRVKEGSAIALVQGGLPVWCECAMECFCFLRNVHDKMDDGKTVFEKGYGKELDGPSIPLGTLVECIPTTAEEKSRVHQFGMKTMNGIFLGYVLHARGGWSVDLMIANYEDLQESEAAEIYVNRSKNKKYS